MTGWPDTKPDLPPVNHGWLCADVRATLRRHLNTETSVVVEVGSWVGKSTRYILQQAPKAHVYCVDTWLGSPEHRRRPDTAAMLPTLYEQFIVNCFELKDRITPVRMKSCDALPMLKTAGVVPDLVYIDGSHEEPDVYVDVSNALDLWPKAIVVGDDARWESVRNGATRATAMRGRHVRINGKSWEVVP